jgi:hypothetical protein
MTTDNESGKMTFWVDGLPYQEIKASNTSNDMQYWIDGLPYPAAWPNSTPPPTGGNQVFIAWFM